jgi:hypothetical protein
LADGVARDGRREKAETKKGAGRREHGSEEANAEEVDEVAEQNVARRLSSGAEFGAAAEAGLEE